MEYENETIFVEIIVDNKSSFRAVQAKRTRENFSTLFLNQLTWRILILGLEILSDACGVTSMIPVMVA
jgi:hypothetical protein